MFTILKTRDIYCSICESNDIKIILTCEHCICRSCISDHFCNILNCPTCEQELTSKEKGFVGIIALLNFYKTIPLYSFMFKIDDILFFLILTLEFYYVFKYDNLPITRFFITIDFLFNLFNMFRINCYNISYMIMINSKLMIPEFFKCIDFIFLNYVIKFNIIPLVLLVYYDFPDYMLNDILYYRFLFFIYKFMQFILLTIMSSNYFRKQNGYKKIDKNDMIDIMNFD